jgi:Barstar (barnase inhibitor)
VSAFEINDETFQRLDYRLLQGGPVVLFWREELLRSVQADLRGLGYETTELDAGGWSSSDVMHEKIASALDFPDYYGRNLNALNDCLGDVATYEYGAEPESAGTVLVISHYDRFAATDLPVATAFTDIFARVARTGLLFGHRMLCLLQVDDPRFSIASVGATPVLWNPEEWLDSRRR